LPAIRIIKIPIIAEFEHIFTQHCLSVKGEKIL
jgi:hypothetical protein